MTQIQVWWLLVSFTWGVERLFNTLELVPSRQNRQWSFGQVMSITLLAIPIVTLVELLYPGKPVQFAFECIPQLSAM